MTKEEYIKILLQERKSNLFLINDPLYGLMSYPRNGIVHKLINSVEFQRLRYIKQLGFVDYVYPGATDSRFSHSLGVAWLTKKSVESLFERGKLKTEDFLEFMDQRDSTMKELIKYKIITTMTCAGLLHDIGHGPFSHTLEFFWQQPPRGTSSIGRNVNAVGHEAMGASIINNDIAYPGTADYFELQKYQGRACNILKEVDEPLFEARRLLFYLSAFIHYFDQILAVKEEDFNIKDYETLFSELYSYFNIDFASILIKDSLAKLFENEDFIQDTNFTIEYETINENKDIFKTNFCNRVRSLGNFLEKQADFSNIALYKGSLRKELINEVKALKEYIIISSELFIHNGINSREAISMVIEGHENIYSSYNMEHEKRKGEEDKLNNCIVNLKELLYDKGKCTDENMMKILTCERMSNDEDEWRHIKSILDLNDDSNKQKVLEIYNKYRKCIYFPSILDALKGLVHSELDCDRLDYLVRDEYHSGKSVQVDYEYIINSQEIAFVDDINTIALVYHKKSKDVIENYLATKYFHYPQIAFNKCNSAAEALCTEILRFLWQNIGFFKSLQINDFYLNKLMLLLGDESTNPQEVIDVFIIFDDQVLMTIIKSIANNPDYFGDKETQKELYKQINPGSDFTTFATELEQFRKKCWSLVNRRFPKFIPDFDNQIGFNKLDNLKTYGLYNVYGSKKIKNRDNLKEFLDATEKCKKQFVVHLKEKYSECSILCESNIFFHYRKPIVFYDCNHFHITLYNYLHREHQNRSGIEKKIEDIKALGSVNKITKEITEYCSHLTSSMQTHGNGENDKTKKTKPDFKEVVFNYEAIGNHLSREDIKTELNNFKNKLLEAYDKGLKSAFEQIYIKNGDNEAVNIHTLGGAFSSLDDVKEPELKIFVDATIRDYILKNKR